jgi:signal transduction histidine kinase
LLEHYRLYVVGIVGLLAAQTVLVCVLVAQWLNLSKLRKKHLEAVVALTDSEARNTAILAALPDLMFVLDEDGNYLDYYARDPAYVYVPPEQFLGKNVRDVMPAELAEVFFNGFQQASLSREPGTIEYSLNIRNKVEYFEARIVKMGNGRILSIVRNVSDKKHDEMELRRLSSRILSLQDEERRRIARELHDVTAQNLFAITVNLQNLREKETGLTSTGNQVFIECLDQCEQSLREVRTLSYVLHPPGLDHLGLIPALQWYVDGFANRSGIEVTLSADPNIGRLLPDMETDIFRIVQEGLSNVFRHSGSTTASILIEKRTGELILKISDRGRGIPKGNGEGERSAHIGVGLLSIRERLNRFGGRLDIHSADSGVTLVAQLPLSKEGLPHERSNGSDSLGG